ncbi:MAG TPA: LLM class F420-dependent oxidoreductase [Mycobacteriales bacterium]|nr:LLM class F420-dependent oxidoreductase [Mycobacteriales bacterium]
MSVRPGLSIGLPNYSPWVPDQRTLLDVARAAEDAGVDRLIVVDHVVIGTHTESYDWGTFPGTPEWPWHEPLTIAAALAAVTTRVRLQTGILIAPLRPPALLAKTVATLDQLSGGRLDLGVGTGWQAEEYAAQGMDFAQRGRLLTETMRACRALWTELPATYEWEGATVEDIYCSPQPAQSPLPVWFSGSMIARNVDRLIELGDGWLPIMGSTADDIAAGMQKLRTAASERGRDLTGFDVQAPLPMVRNERNTIDIEASVGDIGPLLDAGVTNLHLTLRALSGDIDEAVASLPHWVGALEKAAS